MALWAIIASSVGPMITACVQRCASITAHISAASARRTNTLRPPWCNVALVLMNVATWNSGPEFRNTDSSVMSCIRPITRFCAISALCESNAALADAVESRRVHGQQRIVARHVPIDVVIGAGGEDVLVRLVIGDVSVVAQPERRPGSAACAGTLPCRTHRFADLEVLPHDDGRVEIIEHETELGCARSPVDRAEDRAELGCRCEQLDHAERVLPDPRDSIAVGDVAAQRAPWPTG